MLPQLTALNAHLELGRTEENRKYIAKLQKGRFVAFVVPAGTYYFDAHAAGFDHGKGFEAAQTFALDAGSIYILRPLTPATPIGAAETADPEPETPPLSQLASDPSQFVSRSAKFFRKGAAGGAARGAAGAVVGGVISMVIASAINEHQLPPPGFEVLDTASGMQEIQLMKLSGLAAEAPAYVKQEVFGAGRPRMPPSNVESAGAASEGADIETQLATLKRLYGRKLITKKEYDRKRAHLLSWIH